MRVAVSTQQSAFSEWPFVMSLGVLPRDERNPETPATAGRALHGNSSDLKLKPWSFRRGQGDRAHTRLCATILPCDRTFRAVLHGSRWSATHVRSKSGIPSMSRGRRRPVKAETWSAKATPTSKRYRL